MPAGSSRAELGFSKPVPSPFLLQAGARSGHKDTAEKSSFLPAEGSGTHKPASKCVGLYWKQETCAVQNKTKGSISVIKNSAQQHSGNVTKLNAFFHLHSPNEETSNFSLFSLCSPLPCNITVFILLPSFGKETFRQQQCLNRLFLHLSIRNVLSFSVWSCSPSLSLPKDHQITFRLFSLFSSPSACGGLKGWAAKSVPLCSKKHGSAAAARRRSTAVPTHSQQKPQKATKVEAQAESPQTIKQLCPPSLD